jgi:hypothetical protein
VLPAGQKRNQILSRFRSLCAAGFGVDGVGGFRSILWTGFETFFMAGNFSLSGAGKTVQPGRPISNKLRYKGARNSGCGNRRKVDPFLTKLLCPHFGTGEGSETGMAKRPETGIVIGPKPGCQTDPNWDFKRGRIRYAKRHRTRPDHVLSPVGVGLRWARRAHPEGEFFREAGIHLCERKH